MTDKKWQRLGRGRVSGKISAMLPSHYKANWFAQSFNRDYELIYRYTDNFALREVRGCLRYLGLPQSFRKEVEPPVFLDVGCGWGRHALQLATRGYRVVGLDLSEHMLNRAMEEASDASLDATMIASANKEDLLAQYSTWRASSSPLLYVLGDMRKIPWVNEFDVALNLFTSFGYFASERENREVLKGIVQSLIGGGKFIIDVDNGPQFVRRGQGTMNVNFTGTDSEGHEVTRKQEYDVSRGRRVVEYITEDSNGPIYLECELYDSDDLQRLLNSVGLTVISAWGDFDNQRYDDIVSPRLIVLSSKSAE